MYHRRRPARWPPTLTQPAFADDAAAAARELERQAAPVVDRQGQRAGTGEDDGLRDAGDVDMAVDALGRPRLAIRRRRLVLGPLRQLVGRRAKQHAARVNRSDTLQRL